MDTWFDRRCTVHVGRHRAGKGVRRESRVAIYTHCVQC